MKELISLEDIFEAYYDCRTRKRRTANSATFEARDYRKGLVKLWRDINEDTYKISRSICFVVNYPKPREIFAADFRDRIVHHLVINRLMPIFESEFIEDSYSCRVGKGTLYGVNRLFDKVKEASQDYTKDCWIGKFDLKGFFMSINKDRLWRTIRKMIIKKYKGEDIKIILRLTKQIILNDPRKNCYKKSKETSWNRLGPEKSLFTCKEGYGLPIGNITSQLFANYFLNEFDHWMQSMFRWYGRYVDDFYVVAETKEEIISKIERIDNYLRKKLSLSLNRDKTHIQHYTKGVKFIGSVVKGPKAYISNQTISNLYKAIHRFNNMEKTPENALDVRNVLNSYLGFLCQHDTEKKRRKILGKLDTEWWNYLMPKDEHLTALQIRPYYEPKYLKQKEYEKHLEENLWMDSFDSP